MFLRRVTGSLLTAGLLTGLLGIYGGRFLHPTPRDSGTSPETAGSAAFVSTGISPGGKAALDADDERWQRRWRVLSALPDGSERSTALAALLEEFAAIDPRRALALAGAETNPELRAEFFQAALRGWGGTDSDAATAWADSQALLDRGQALSAVFHGAARDPEDVLRLAAELSAQDPGRAGDYGSYLVAAFNRAGEFHRAAGFAADAPPEIRVDLLNAAYAGWGDREPQAALQAIAQLSDPGTKKMAFAAAISRWANHDAKAAADYALDLPTGDGKTFALAVALRAWAAADAAEAGIWMNRFEASPELDFGAAVIASLPETLLQPQVATGWAESITDSRLRTRVLATVVAEWAATDPGAALFYAENSPHIRPEDRATVLSAFHPDFSPVSLSP